MALSEDQTPLRPPVRFDARSAVVNRTHRIVRERAAALKAQKRRTRDLIVPFAVCSTVLLLIAFAVWSVADENLAGWEGGLWKRVMELGTSAGDSISLLLIWFLPLSVITAAVVLLRRGRQSGRDDRESR